MPGRAHFSPRKGAKLPEENKGMQHPDLVVDADDIIWALVSGGTEELTEVEAGIGAIDAAQLPILADWYEEYSKEKASVVRQIYARLLDLDDGSEHEVFWTQDVDS
jgi:hypothetical protein